MRAGMQTRLLNPPRFSAITGDYVARILERFNACG